MTEPLLRKVDQAGCSGKFALVSIVSLVVIGLIASFGIDTTPNPPANLLPIRLPAHVIPTHYHLTLQTNLTTFQYNGTVVIDLQVTRATSRIILHAVAMNISDARVGDVAASRTQLVAFPHEFFVMDFPSQFAPGMHQLSLQFHAPLGTSLAGYYRSSYRDSEGRDRWLAVSQYAAVDARRGFPCFDEPGLKANFTMVMITDPDYFALSNMPERARSTDPVTGHMRFEFYPSVRMSTYLLAYLVSDYQSIGGTTKSGTAIKIWTPPGKESQARIALQAALVILPYFEQLFDLPYPLAKLDMAAIPDFAFNAMENWGLITYRETALLFDEQESSSANLQNVVRVISHEIAHQWFGNMVTMDWWDGLWLNEGFASIVQFFGMEHAHPDWNTLTQFVATTQQNALRLDASTNSHPIVVDVADPADIGSLFDAISYDKGASVIRMLIGLLGDDTFFAGINLYLRRYSFSNANTPQLWATLQEVVDRRARTDASLRGIDIASIMDGWTRQMGYPVVTVAEVPGSSTQLVATQKQFYLQPNTPPSSAVWDIKLVWSTDAAPLVAREQWFWASADSVTLPFSRTDGAWLKLDLHETSFYRVNYTAPVWSALARELVQSAAAASRQAFADVKLNETDRAGLVDDAFALARGNIITIGQALDVSRFLANETNYNPWQSGLNQLMIVDTLLAQSGSTYGLFRQYLRQLLNRPVSELGWTVSGTQPQRLLRALLLALASDMELDSTPPARPTAFALFREMVANSSFVLPSDVREAVYATGMQDGGAEAFDFMLNRYRTTTVGAEAIRCLRALAKASQPWLISRLLQLSLDQSVIRAQDGIILLVAVAQNSVGAPLVWDFVRDNFGALLRTYGEGAQFSNLLRGVTERFQTERRYEEVDSFFKAQPNVGTGRRAIQQGLESIRANIEWLASNRDAVHAWLCRELRAC